MGLKLNIILIASIIVFFFAILPNILRFVGWIVELTPWAFYAVVVAGALLGISAFLPYDWGRILRSASYISLFIAILLLEIGVMGVAVERYPMLNITQCETLFPVKEEGEKGMGRFMWDAVSAASCIFTGYYPAEFGALGLTVFLIFYLILPFAVIFAYTYGIMRGLKMEDWLGGYNVGKNVVLVISVVISLYAARVLFGAFLLQFLGYGAWGLFGIFGAIFIVKGLEHVINKWYGVEKELFEAKKAWEEELELQKRSIKNCTKFVKSAKTHANLNDLITRGTPAYRDCFKYLPEEMRTEIKHIIERPATLVQKRSKILKVLKGERAE